MELLRTAAVLFYKQLSGKICKIQTVEKVRFSAQGFP